MAGAQDLRASLLYKIKLGEHAAPADVVLYDDGRTGIYDAYSGRYTVYKGDVSEGGFQSEMLKGGNCFVANGNYFLYCDSVNSSVDMISASGELYKSFSIPSDIKGKYDPTDALVSDGFLFTADNDNHRVVKADLATGEVAMVQGGYGDSKLKFWYPYALSMDSKGVLYVSEVLNTRVQKITKELKFYEFYGSWGIKPGEFFRPTGVAVYKGDNVLVGDGYTGVIQYLDNEGRFTGLLKDKSGNRLSLGSVTHIRVNGDRLGVVDAFGKTVYIFELEELK